MRATPEKALEVATEQQGGGEAEQQGKEKLSNKGEGKESSKKSSSTGSKRKGRSSSKEAVTPRGKTSKPMTSSKQGLKMKDVTSSSKSSKQTITPNAKKGKAVTPSSKQAQKGALVSLAAEGSSGNSVMPKKKKRKSRTELVEEVVREEEEAHEDAEEDKSLNLFNFLYNNNGDSDEETSMVEDFDLFFKMFNPLIDIDEIIIQGYDYLEPFLTEYLDLVSEQTVDVNGTHYIHLTSVGNKNSSSRRAIARRVHLLPTSATLVIEDCPFHMGGCRVVEKYVAFICYLASLGNTEEEKILQDEYGLHRLQSEKKEEEEEDVEQDKIELTLEQKKLIRFESIKELQNVDEDTLNDGDIALPALPTFTIMEKEYVLLHDIQVLFNLREDYCLALIAQ